MRGTAKWFAVVAVVIGLVSTAVAHDVLEGFDLFETDPNETDLDFGGMPIPADFFEPGSDPFVDLVPLQGVPLIIDPNCPNDGLGNVDTIVRRRQPAVLPAPGTSDVIEIEIVELSLTSIDPVIVTKNGGQDPEPWWLDVEISPLDLSEGTMSIRKDNAQGGTFDSDILVYPRFTFTKISNPTEVRVLDGFNEGFSIRFTATDVPWVHIVPPGNSCTSNFCVNPESLTVHQALWASHGVYSVCPMAPTATEGARWGSIKSLYR